MMAIFRDAKPDDPMYREGPQSYSPHWARKFRPRNNEAPKLPETIQPEKSGSSAADTEAEAEQLPASKR